MRRLYTLILYLLVPVVLLRLYRLGFSDPEYRRRWGERFGFVPRLAPNARRVWVHAVSVGEVQAALPLIQSLRERLPEIEVVITTTTPTGADAARRGLGKDIRHFYVPYDLPGAVRRFLSRVDPALAIMMETELWPNLCLACSRAGIPLMIANARLSQRSAEGYRRFARLTRGMMAEISAFAAQSRADAERFELLGADPARISVTGSVKFDIRLPASISEQAQALRRRLGVNRPVWIAASTHEGEEEAVIEAHRGVVAKRPDAALVLVPRHPPRAGKVAELCQKQGFAVVIRSQDRYLYGEPQIFLVDTMGELPLFYSAADVAFVGGSLVPKGGHNILEPGGLGLPVITGPFMFNFAQISDLMVEVGAAWVVRNAAELAAKVTELLGDAECRHAAGDSARRVVEANRGAVNRVLEIALSLLSGNGAGRSAGRGCNA